MKYEQEILKILYEAGSDGLSVRKIARHVFNAHNSLFETTSYEDTYKAVLAFIAKCRKNRDSAIESTGKWGLYRLNTESKESRQLMLEFKDDAEDEAGGDATQQKDLSLSLF